MLTPPPPVLRVDESASVFASALTEMSPLETITAPSLPTVTAVVEAVVALEVAAEILMPPPLTDRICATVASMPSAVTAMLLAPASSSVPLETRTSPSRAACVLPLSTAAGLLLLTATSPPASDSAVARASLLAAA
ncbi:MAG: hypothetical protein BWX88_03620 [Planctomycetes bacterium ADurb.Bin126]|nr:MAG: hypothetical protein BWX88_03620 [Planctomycetes bacterium ADurb.Bin126]